jgi:hypothetical protein
MFCNLLIVVVLNCVVVQVIKSIDDFNCSTKTAEKATVSLAKVGSRAALNFSFAFLRRAWRSGMLLFLYSREEVM